MATERHYDGDIVRPLTTEDFPDSCPCCEDGELEISPPCDCQDTATIALYREGILSLVCTCCQAAIAIAVAGPPMGRN